jgi:hypothetical protein
MSLYFGVVSAVSGPSVYGGNSKIQDADHGLFTATAVDEGEEIFRSEPLLICVEEGMESRYATTVTTALKFSSSKLTFTHCRGCYTKAKGLLCTHGYTAGTSFITCMVSHPATKSPGDLEHPALLLPTVIHPNPYFG